MWIVAMITLGEVSEWFRDLFRGIGIGIVDFLTSVLTILAVLMVIFGVIAFAAGREYLGYRLLAGGGTLLIVMHLIVPRLLSFV